MLTSPHSFRAWEATWWRRGAEPCPVFLTERRELILPPASPRAPVGAGRVLAWLCFRLSQVRVTLGPLKLRRKYPKGAVGRSGSRRRWLSALVRFGTRLRPWSLRRVRPLCPVTDSGSTALVNTRHRGRRNAARDSPPRHARCCCWEQGRWVTFRRRALTCFCPPWTRSLARGSPACRGRNVPVLA